jgi:hypothetical protein
LNSYPTQNLEPAARANSRPANNLTLEPGTYDKPVTEGRDADALKLLIMRVQAALYSKGYDPGCPPLSYRWEHTGIEPFFRVKLRRGATPDGFLLRQ